MHTVVGVTLASKVAVLGLGNSYPVCITGLLTPGTLVQASFDAIGQAFSVATARG